MTPTPQPISVFNSFRLRRARNRHSSGQAQQSSPSTGQEHATPLQHDLDDGESFQLMQRAGDNSIVDNPETEDIGDEGHSHDEEEENESPGEEEEGGIEEGS